MDIRQQLQRAADLAHGEVVRCDGERLRAFERFQRLNQLRYTASARQLTIAERGELVELGVDLEEDGAVVVHQETAAAAKAPVEQQPISKRPPSGAAAAAAQKKLDRIEAEKGFKRSADAGVVGGPQNWEDPEAVGEPS